MQERATGAILAVKLLKRGRNIDDNVKREIMNHQLCNMTITSLQQNQFINMARVEP